MAQEAFVSCCVGLDLGRQVQDALLRLQHLLPLGGPCLHGDFVELAHRQDQVSGRSCFERQCPAAGTEFDLISAGSTQKHLWRITERVNDTPLLLDTPQSQQTWHLRVWNHRCRKVVQVSAFVEL